MNIEEAFQILEVDQWLSNNLLKENFRWLVKHYHPDNKTYGNVVEFRKVIEAYTIIKDKENQR